MQEVSMEDRQKELNALRAQLQAHPERDWTEQKKRMQVLNEMLADHSDKSAH